jgi:hypothetical protein
MPLTRHYILTALGINVDYSKRGIGSIMLEYSRLSDNVDIKRLLGVYYEQNVNTEKYEDYDGERWVVLNEQQLISILILCRDTDIMFFNA